MKFDTSLTRLAIVEAVVLSLAACGGGGGGTASAAAGVTRGGNEEALASESGTWVPLVDEGETFSVNGTQTVRIGAGTRWAEKFVSGAGACTNEFFASDPAPGFIKACQLFVPSASVSMAPGPADTSKSWMQVANESDKFTTIGSQVVRFGSGDNWSQRSVNGVGYCSNSFFGIDPAPGTWKVCQILASGAGAAPAPTVNGWTQVAEEWEGFAATGTARFGSGSNWVERAVSGTASCTTSYFGSDPAPGIVKVCQVGGTSTAGPAPTPVATIPLVATTAPVAGGAGLTGPGLGTLPSNPRLNSGVSGEQVQSTPEQAYGSNDGIGDFRTRCLPSHFAFDDPIVFPGQAGRSHLHVFFGNTNSNANSTADSLKNTGNSTCRGGTVNRSSYWVPALIDTTTNQPVVPDESDFYYKSGYKGVQPGQIQPIPAGLRMISGDPSNRVDLGYNSPYTWVCHNAGTNRGQTIPTCGAGDQLELSIAFPQCWDGVNLDSPDHKSHMAYGNGSGCPSSHPVALPEVSFHVLYPVSSRQGSWRLSSDAATGGAGYSAHADWFNGWKQDVSDAWSRRCVAEGKDCHSHLLGDGRAIY